MTVQELDRMLKGPSTLTRLAPVGLLLVTWLARLGRAVRPYLSLGVLGVLCFPIAAAMISHALAVAVLGLALLVIERAVKG